VTVLISLLSLAALVLAISCTVLFTIAAAIELLPAPPAQSRGAEGRDEDVAFGGDDTRMTPGR
jgi:hypothetical protein